jgi:hypothetical protein
MMHKKPIWNDNPFDQWREEELLCMGKGGICYGKGGGGQQQPSQPAVSTQVQQSEFPTELKPFIQDIFGKAQAIQESKEGEGFQAFEGPLQSEFDPAQTKAFAQIEAVPGATKPLFDEATTLARGAAAPLPTAEEIQSASNPFVRNVLDIQKREAERVSDVQGQRQDAAAAQAGAFGGSRAAILEAERQRNLNQQLGDIEATGQLAAFQDAQQRIAQQRGREASGATQLAALGSAIPAQQLKELGALSGVGAARQTQAQRGIDLARQEFEAEEAFPSQTLQEFSSVLRGFPLAPTRSTSTQQFSAAQPLSTQLLGVGTQALGALGSAGAFKGAFGQAGGAVSQMPVQKYQGGGALNSLINNTAGLDTQPVIGMAGGGGFKDIMSILSPAYGMGRAAKKGGLKGLMTHISPAFAMSQGKLPMGLSKLMGDGGSDAPPPPQAAAPTISQEDVDKQIDAALRQRAAQGQQSAAAGAPRAQASSQVGNQVRQPFKEGGGLSQMVRLPSNRVQFGKAAYADVTEEQTFLDEVNRFKGLGRLPRPGTNSPIMLFPPSADPVTSANTGTSSVDSPAIRQAETAAQLARLGPNMMVEEMGPVAQIGEAPARLGGGRSEVDKAAELDIAPAPTALASKPKASGPPAPKPKAEEVKLYREPEEAAYGSLIDGGYFKDKTPMINKQNNTALSNISEGLRAYKGFKDAEMSQRQKINAANLKRAASTRAIEKDRLGRALTQAEIREKLFAPKVKLLESYQSVIDSKREAMANMLPQHPQYKTLRAEIAQAEAGMAKIQAMGIDAPELLESARLMGFSGTDLPQRKAK